MQTCKNCHGEFQVTAADLEFYKHFDSPPPTFCPDCRQQRRLTYRNERKFYRRKCDATGKSIISIYSADKPCKVYDQEVWWSDTWDPMQYGRDVDFSRPFFEQFDELARATPRPCIVNMSSQNSLYTNHSAYNKNCYMCINTGYCEDMFYCSNFTIYSKDGTDNLAVQNCEMCSYCIDTKKSSFSSYLLECQNCVDSAFLFDCRDCQNCFGCWNLRHKQYCIYNEQYSKDEYFAKLAQIAPQTFEEAQKTFDDFRARVNAEAIHRSTIVDFSENSFGDHLTNDRNVQDSYYTFECEDCSYCYDCGNVKTGRDVMEPLRGELQFETNGCNLGYSLMACSKCYECTSVSYSQYCWYSTNCFGCFGLRRKQYCILNKQYTKEEYEVLVTRIIEHMKKNGEYGEFFPIESTEFGYNETAAQDYFPLTREQALQRRYKWKDEETRGSVPQTFVVPDLISQVPDSITNEILACTQCGKNYKIIGEELAFYRKSKLPIPTWCFDCRYAKRIGLRAPRKLSGRECTLCGTKINSVYAPGENGPAHVYCENCYQKAIYG